MKIYKQFHGEILISEIGKELRRIVNIEKKPFKIMTGYGSESGKSNSKQAALTSLIKMKKAGIIRGYFPGGIKDQVLDSSSPYYEFKLDFGNSVKNDSDYGNEGIIFIFV